MSVCLVVKPWGEIVYHDEDCPTLGRTAHTRVDAPPRGALLCSRCRSRRRVTKAALENPFDNRRRVAVAKEIGMVSGSLQAVIVAQIGDQEAVKPSRCPRCRRVKGIHLDEATRTWECGCGWMGEVDWRWRWVI